MAEDPKPLPADLVQLIEMLAARHSASASR